MNLNLRTEYMGFFDLPNMYDGHSALTSVMM